MNKNFIASSASTSKIYLWKESYRFRRGSDFFLPQMEVLIFEAAHHGIAFFRSKRCLAPLSEMNTKFGLKRVGFVVWKKKNVKYMSC